MNNIGEIVGNTGAVIKMLSGILITIFIIYSLYFFGNQDFTIFKGVLALLVALLFVGFTSMLPFGQTFLPILFEWWWHDIPFWEFTTFAWVVTGISMAANILILIGLGSASRQGAM